MILEIDCNTGWVDTDLNEMEVQYKRDDWDSSRQWRMDLKEAARNSNDCINGAVEEALEKIGYCLSDKRHTFNEDEESITYKIVKLKS